MDEDDNVDNDDDVEVDHLNLGVVESSEDVMY